MILQETPEGLLAITQPAHAALCGEMARAWDREAFGNFEPFREVCLGAEQHDCGWLDWEREPVWSPEKRRPLSFTELRTSEHLKIWTRGPRLAETMNPYAGLIVSLHGTGLYARYKSDDPDPAVKEWMEAEERRRGALVARLAGDPAYAPFVTPEVLRKNQALVAAWDFLSLILCLGADARRIENVPSARGPVALEVKRQAPDAWSVDPWPFRDRELDFAIGARLLSPPHASEADMRSALFTAPWITRTFRLTPARS